MVMPVMNQRYHDTYTNTNELYVWSMHQHTKKGPVDYLVMVCCHLRGPGNFFLSFFLSATKKSSSHVGEI